LAEIEESAVRVESLNKEYTQLSSDLSPLAKVEKDKLTYSQDIEKFSKFIEHLQLRKEKFVDTISRLEEDNNSAGKTLFMTIRVGTCVYRSQSG
jgi:hypothetical protein